MANKNVKILDLFAGAGGLSEGFWQEGYDIVGHIEMDRDACETLKTRAIYHSLKNKNKLSEYREYLKGNISREELVKKYKLEKELNKIINVEITKENCDELIAEIKELANNKKINGIIGGPPCQAYSNIGRARDRARMRNDDRNHLYKFYLRFLEKLNPDFFVFENVPGLLSAGSGKYLDLMIDGMRALGYTIEKPTKETVLDTSDYGVPQKRKRIIMLGFKSGINIDTKKIFKSSTPKHESVNQFLEDLPNLKSGNGVEHSTYRNESKLLSELGIRDNAQLLIDHITRPHNERDLAIYKIAVHGYKKEKTLKYNELPSHLKTHRNEKSFLDRYKVIEGCHLACHTIVAHISKDGHYYIHPDIRQNRSLSVREAARLQTFPDSYKLEGARASKFKQIGNAVPPMFSRILAKRLKKYFK